MSTFATVNTSEEEESQVKENPVNPPNPQLTHYQMLVKVRAKMKDLYEALDAFKGDLVADASDLVTQQLVLFSELIPGAPKEEDEVVEKKDESQDEEEEDK